MLFMFLKLLVNKIEKGKRGLGRVIGPGLIWPSVVFRLEGTGPKTVNEK